MVNWGTARQCFMYVRLRTPDPTRTLIFKHWKRFPRISLIITKTVGRRSLIDRIFYCNCSRFYLHYATYSVVGSSLGSENFKCRAWSAKIIFTLLIQRVRMFCLFCTIVLIDVFFLFGSSWPIPGIYTSLPFVSWHCIVYSQPPWDLGKTWRLKVTFTATATLRDPGTIRNWYHELQHKESYGTARHGTGARWYYQYVWAAHAAIIPKLSLCRSLSPGPKAVNIVLHTHPILVVCFIPSTGESAICMWELKMPQRLCWGPRYPLHCARVRGEACQEHRLPNQCPLRVNHLAQMCVIQ